MILYGVIGSMATVDSALFSSSAIRVIKMNVLSLLYISLNRALAKLRVCLNILPIAPFLSLNLLKSLKNPPCTMCGNAFRLLMAIPHNSKRRYGERGAADAKPKAQIVLDAAKVSAASGGNNEPKQGQGQRSQSARGFCPRSTMRVPQPDIIEHFGNADAVPQLPERCLSRKAGIVRYCLKFVYLYCWASYSSL